MEKVNVGLPEGVYLPSGFAPKCPTKITLLILSIFDKIYQRKIIKKFLEIFDDNLDIVFDVGAHEGEFIKLILNNKSILKKFSGISNESKHRTNCSIH